MTKNETTPADAGIAASQRDAQRAIETTTTPTARKTRDSIWMATCDGHTVIDRPTKGVTGHGAITILATHIIGTGYKITRYREYENEHGQIEAQALVLDRKKRRYTMYAVLTVIL